MIGKPEESNTGVSGEAETVLPEISGKATFLLACGSDDGQTLHLAALVGADMEEQSFSIYMLDPDARVNAGLGAFLCRSTTVGRKRGVETSGRGAHRN